jgi:hypothetical protein
LQQSGRYPEPENLLALKADLVARCPMTGLFDMLKETAVRVGFSDAFRSGAAFERMDPATPSNLVANHRLAFT